MSRVEAIAFAQSVQDVDEAQRIEMLHHLRKSMMLSATVRALNCLAEDKDHKPLAERALASLWLNVSG